MTKSYVAKVCIINTNFMKKLLINHAAKSKPKYKLINLIQNSAYKITWNIYLNIFCATNIYWQNYSFDFSFWIQRQHYI